MLLLASFMVFALVHVIPGDPISVYLTESALNPEAEAALRDELNLDDPLLVRYGKWLGHAAQGDLGKSFRTKEPVMTTVLASLPATLQLAGAALVVAVVVGIPAGIVSAASRNGWVDLGSRWVALGGLAVPNFFMGIILVYVFAFKWGVLPATGYVSVLDSPVDGVRSTILPALALGTSLAAVLFRQMRGALLDVLNEDYIRTARAKGLRNQTVIVRHGVRNAMLPVVTLLGMYSGILIGGAVVTEQVFAYPGIGTQAVAAIRFRDIDILQGVILLTVVAVILGNLVTDVVYARLNPRIRLT
ncbi:MAG: ABC transporter permease [Dehalococcoidia bacterium]|nr:ABC transporter permease [Dehalococcoidia bacterium]